MNDFNSIFEELSKLYEEAPRVTGKETDTLCSVDFGGTQLFVGTREECEDWIEKHPDPAGKNSGRTTVKNNAKINVVEGCDKSLTEAEDDEVVDIVDDEAPVEEEPVEEEPVTRQLALECTNCGAITLRDEPDVKVEEETGLANIEEPCEFCEEAKGRKIVGVVTPYEVAEAAEEAEVVEEALKEGIFDKKNSADMNNARRAWENKVKEVTDGKTLTDIAGDFVSAIRSAILEYGQYIYDNYDSTTVAKSFETQAKMVIKLHEETIKSLTKPANFYAPYSIILRVVRKITGQDGIDSDALARIEDYKVLTKVNSIEADKKIKAEALQNFSKAIIRGLNNNLQWFKKLPYPGAMFKRNN